MKGKKTNPKSTAVEANKVCPDSLQVLCEHCDCDGLASAELASTLAFGWEQHEKGFSHGLQRDSGCFYFTN